MSYLLAAGEDKLLKKDDVRGILDGTLFYRCGGIWSLALHKIGCALGA